MANSYTYEAFGKLTASAGSLINPFRHTARDFDNETGFYYHRARYRDNALGRFLSEDPWGFADGPNKYGYVHNRPTSSSDPWGLYELKGFSPEQEVFMRDAINKALAKLTACCAGPRSKEIRERLLSATFEYRRDPVVNGQALCGYSRSGLGLLTYLYNHITITSDAFTPRCGSLASTVVHEGVHRTVENNMLMPLKDAETQAGIIEGACFP